MLTVTPDVALLHNNLGMELKSQGRLDEAIRYYHQALRIEPDSAEAHKKLQAALAEQKNR